MSAEGLIGIAVMLVLSVVYVALPYVRGTGARGTAGREQLALIAAYERALMTVRDLDEDYQVGKLAAEPYQAERAYWVEYGASTLQALEKLGGVPAKAKRHKPKPVETVPPLADDAVEQAIAAYARARSER